MYSVHLEQPTRINNTMLAQGMSEKLISLRIFVGYCYKVSNNQGARYPLTATLIKHT